MAKLGTAFVSVEADLSKFNRQVAAKLGRSLQAAGERSGRDFTKGFEQRTSGVLLPIDRALKNVVASTDKVIEATKRSGKQTNLFGRDGEASFAATSKAAKAAGAAIEDVGSKAASLATITPSARFDFKIAAADKDIDRLQAHIATLLAGPQTVEVKAEVGKALIELDRVQARKDRLIAQKAEIKVDVDQGVVGRFSAITNAAKNLLSTLGGGGGGLSNVAARVSLGFVNFGTSLGVAAAAAAVIVPIIVSIAAALAALVSSLALAAAGAAALGAALGGVVAAGVGLLIPVGIRLGKVFESLKADNAATDALARNAAAGSQAAAAAAKAQEGAARGLTDANRSLAEASSRVGVAAKAAYREMADAAEAASDAIRGVANAQLSLDQAKLSTEQATLELEKFRGELGATGDAFGAAFKKFTDVSIDTSGLRKAIADANAAGGGTLDQSQELELRQKILDVRAARLREKDAVDGVSDAVRESSRAQEVDNEFKRKGIAASQGYQAALKGVESATRGVADAQRAVADANEAAATGAGIAAQEKATQLAGKLTKAEIHLKNTLRQVGHELRGAFTPATNAVVTGLAVGVSRIPALINPLRGAFTRLGEAWRNAIVAFSSDLIKPETVNSLRAFIDGAAKLAGPITHGLLSLFHIFLDIGKSALPFLVKGAQKVADAFARWAKTTSNTKKLDKAIGGIVGHLSTWLDVTGALGKTFIAFITAAAGPGKGLAQDIKDLADRTTAWLNSKEGRAELKQFFTDAIALAKNVAKFITEIVVHVFKFSAAVSHLVSRFGGAKRAADVLIGVLGAIVAFKVGKGIVNGISDIASGLGAANKAAKLLHAKFFTLSDAEAGGGLIAKSKAALVSIGQGLAAAGRGVLRAGREVAARLIGIFARQGALAGGAAGSAAAGTEGLAIGDLLGRVRDAGASIGRGLVAGVRGALGGLASIGKTVINAVIGVINSAAELINKPIRLVNKLPGPDIPTLHRIPVLLGLAKGGIIPGYGTGDIVPALLTPGEYVTRQFVVKRFGPTVFADINAGKLDPRVGYQPGQRPSVGPVRASGPRFATGGSVGATATLERPNVTNNNNITVPGGGPPDPTALVVAIARVGEQRYGGSTGQF